MPMSDSVLVAVVVVAALALTLFGGVLLRRWRLSLRPIRAYAALPTLVDEAIESDRTVHVSFGNAGVGAETTLTALVGAEALATLAERAAIGERSPLVTVSDPLGLALAQDTLRRGYAARGALARFNRLAATWLPQGPGSLAFAAGAASLASDEGCSANVLIGRFGAEMIVIGEMGARRGATQVAGSDLLEGQAVAFATSEMPLIGEEMFVGGAYLSDDPVKRGGVLAQDALRAAVIVIIVVSFIVATLTAGV
jgi:hypothetical protein